MIKIKLYVLNKNLGFGHVPNKTALVGCCKYCSEF